MEIISLSRINNLSTKISADCRRWAMDPETENGKEPEILFTHLMEGIGLALDLKGGRMFITDFGGSVYSANLDGSNRRTLLAAEGNLTGIAYAEVPSGY